MSEVTVDLTGYSENEQALTRLVASLTDLRLFWPMVVPIFIRWMRDQFESEGDWGGERWAELTPAYAVRKAMLYPGKSILIANGDLRDAASRPTREVSPTRLVLTIEDEKAGYHQEGTDRMVARPIIPDTLPASADAELDEAAQTYVDELTRRLGLR